MLRVADRVKETTTSTGTGALTLAGAMTGFQPFSAVCSDQDTVWYALQAVDSNGVPTGAWEVGVGTYTASGNTLTRTTVLASSNSGSAVSLAAGTTQVWCDLPAKRIFDPFYTGSANRPKSASFTLNQNSNLASTASLADLPSGRGFVMSVPNHTASASNFAQAVQSVPGGSWTLMAELIGNTGILNSSSRFGICVRDSAGGMITFGFAPAGGSSPFTQREVFDSSGTLQNSKTWDAPVIPGVPVWLRLVYNGTQFTFGSSVNGETWVDEQTFSASGFTPSFNGTPSTAGIHMDTNNAATQSGLSAHVGALTCLHFSIG